MASTVPIPRSQQTILGDIISAFSARYGIRRLQVGGAILTAFEAASASDFRGTQDIFNLLDLDNFNRLSGSALAYKAAGEGVEKQGATPATGSVTFTDTSFIKLSTRIFSGAAAPPAGSAVLLVSDASKFPPTGTVYVGRSTINFEGPISYTAVTNPGGHWQLTLATPTQRFHNLNEEVVLGQGGNRVIMVGQNIGTATNGRTTSVGFQTTKQAVIPDGETYVANVPIICTQPGTLGNVPAESIQNITNPPFAGCTVTNPGRLDNGLDIESDASLLERLRNTRASKSRGTPTAILTAVQGIFDSTESKRVLSAQLVGLSGRPQTLYIDDGTGYEEQNTGIGTDVLMDAASGGEKFFALTALRPIAKAFVSSSLMAPFALPAGSVLAVRVGGILSEHTFNATDFISIGAATAQEIVSSINADSGIAFSARTTGDGTGFAVFARSDTGEDIAVTTPTSGTDANVFFGFTSTLTYTARIYKNDQLLYKDGRQAILTSTAQSAWHPMATGIQLRISVDSTPFQTYTFTDADFIAAGTGYTTLSQTNSVDSWAAVINAKIPGITAANGGGFLTMVSNLGYNGRAGLQIQASGGSDFIGAGVFTSTTGLSAAGINADYTMDRMTAQIELTTPLEAGDTLSVGSGFTRGYLQSATISGGAISFNATARLWLAVDCGVQMLTPSVTAGTTYTFQSGTGADNGERTTVTASVSTAYGTSTSLLQVGDTVIIWDPAVNGNGVFRVCEVPSVAPFDHFVIERPALPTQTGVQLTSGGIVYCRLTGGVAQEVRLPASGGQALTDVAAEFNARVSNATASVYRNTYFRLTTNSFDANVGSITLLAADTAGQSLFLPLGIRRTSTLAHRGALQTSKTEVGTPIFTNTSAIRSGRTGALPNYVHSDLYNVGGRLAFEFDPNHDANVGRLLYGIRRAQNGGRAHFGAQVDRHYVVKKAATVSSKADYVLRKTDAALNIASGSLVRAGSTVTVTTAAAHNFVVGDYVWVEYQTTADANFAAGVKVVATVPSASTFTYTEAGSAASSTQTYGCNLWDGTWDSTDTGAEDIWAPTVPFSISPRDTLNLVLNNDPNTQSFAVPMWRRVKPVTTTYAAGVDIQVVDADNGNQPLSTLFGTSNPNYFQDFFAYMHARAMGHGNDSTKQILWRSVRVGPECNNYTLAYVNPNLGETTQKYDFSLSAANTFDIRLHIPYGTPRSGLGVQAATMFTWTVTPVVGPPAYNQVVLSYSAPVINSGQLSRTSNVVTANTATNHGFSSGQVVYVTISDGNFPAGAKLITVTSATQFTYAETGSNATSGVSGSVSSVSTAPNFGGISVGDVIILTNDGTNSVQPLGSWRVYANTSTTITFRVPATNSATTQATPQKIGGTGNNLIVAPLQALTANSYATFVNADSVLKTVVSAHVMGTGLGTITESTADDYFSGTNNTAAGSVQQWTFTDGLNYVSSSNLGASPNDTMQLKNDAGNTELSTASDFSDEEIYLVPVTAATAVRWLQTPVVSGAYATTDFDVTGLGSIQMASRVMGSSGGVQVVGGQANAGAAALVAGGEYYLSTYGRVALAADSSLPFVGNNYVALQNSLPTPKSLGLNSASTLQVAANGTLTFGSNVWATQSPGDLITGSGSVSVTKVGNFAVYVFTNLTTISDPTGNFVTFTVANLSSANVGTFRICGFTNFSAENVAYNAFWVENANAVSEIKSYTGADSATVYTANSIMPGDTITIGYNLGGFAANRGSFVVTALGALQTQVVVNYAGFVPATDTLGANYPTIVDTEPAFRLIEKVALVAPNPVNSSQNYLTFVAQNSAQYFGKLTTTLGATVTALDKFGFPTEPVTGADGYAISTGLIYQVTRALYGDPNAPTIYPGMVAAGATVYVSGPNIKRIRVSFQIRIRSGLNQKTVISQVQSAVASEVNRIPLGQSVDLSRLVRVARAVQGVLSVVVLSPTYSSANDVIAVQANERPFIYTPATDVAITVVT